MMDTKTPAVFATAALWLLTGAALTRPASAAPAAAKPAAPSAAVQVVQQFLADRSADQGDRASALMTAADREQFLTSDQRDKMFQSLTDPQAQTKLSPDLLPVLALFLDMHDTLHFKFRVLGPSPGDPDVVLVRAYQVGTPLSSIKVLKVVTTADADSDGARRIDGQKTAMGADPSAALAQQSVTKEVSKANLKQIAAAAMKYAQDHDQRLPDADSWVDDIMPYLKTETVFHDPGATDPNKWSYAFNKALSGVSLTDIPDPAHAVLVFESTLGVKNAGGDSGSVPVPGWHKGGTDYAFADGHVEWLADGALPLFEPPGIPTPDSPYGAPTTYGPTP